MPGSAEPSRDTVKPRLAAMAVLALAGALCGCQKPLPLASRCTNLASAYLDPAWGPRQVVTHPYQGVGVSETISAQGRSVAVECSGGMTMGGPVLEPSETTVQGRVPAPGQIYPPTLGRWLTPDEARGAIRP